VNLPSLLSKFEEHPFNPAPESHLIDLHRPWRRRAKIRSLRTKLNYMQTLQSLHTVVVTSASPAEGKSFTAMNLALAESHLADNSVLVADFDPSPSDAAQPAAARPQPGYLGLPDG